MASLWIGTIGSLFALAFLHQKEAAAMGVCRWLFGKDVLIEAYPFHDRSDIVCIAIIGSSRYYCEFINREREK